MDTGEPLKTDSDDESIYGIVEQMRFKSKKSMARWLTEHLSSCLGFVGTLAMSYSMIPAPKGNGMMLDGIGKSLTPFALIRHG